MPKKPKSRGATAASAPAPPARKRPKPTYEPPKLMKFEKLERLIVSGE